MEKDKELEAKIEEILSRGVAEVIDREHLKKRLLSGEKLRVKFGIDPTSPDLHLGHTVALKKLKQFQELGHKIIFLIGDFTAKIGDPSGRSEMRKILADDEIKENMKDYEKQAAKILDIKKVEVRHNSEWYKNKGPNFLFELTSKVTVARALERDDFKKRLKEDTDVSVLEIIYPLMQGYDSVELKADVEIGGTDQKFNLLMGRKIQRRYSKKEQDIITVPLLEGTDGVLKMSKSYRNYISLTVPAKEMFSKIMSIPDGLIIKYFRLLTDVKEDLIKNINTDMKSGKLNPRDAKLCLAHDIVKIYHGKEKAKAAQKYFIGTFSKREIPEDVAVVLSPAPEISIIDYLIETGLVKSKSDARRLIEQGGVEMDGKKVTDWRMILNSKFNNSTLKIGKHNHRRIEF
jgi:tyrosyl-tRNA synthetase